LSRIDELAAWLKVSMPLDDLYLSKQEALDIAAFVNSHSWLKFVLKEHPPKAGRVGEYNAERSDR
jgi:thiosulfate dehydrogenase